MLPHSSLIIFFVCQKYALTLLELCLFETGKESSWGNCTADCRFVFSGIHRLCRLCLSFLWCSCLEDPLCTTIVMTVKHVFEGGLTCLNQLFNFFSLLFFIIYPQSFLIWRASALMHPHRWALLSLMMENMCLATTFTWWEVSARNYGSGISSSIFPLDVFRNWPRSPIKVCLRTAHIVLSSSRTMKSTMKIDHRGHPLPFLI